MIPNSLIDFTSGMSIITATALSFVSAIAGYFVREYKMYKTDIDKKIGKLEKDTDRIHLDLKRCINKRVYEIRECTSAIDKRVAVIQERDNAVQSDINEIKRNVGKIFGCLKDLSVGIAEIKRD